ncbi:hypothetical protein PRNP1_006863 [Phytophthora ramorum]
MEDTRRAIRDGRRLADEGRYAAATEAWKAALSGAYALQDYAGIFVLSSNLGEACVQIATRSTDWAGAAELLREAMEHLDYALQVVDQCSLREVLGGYRALYRSVRRVETTRRKAKKLMEKVQVEEVMKEVKRSCTTCGVASGDVVLDENDGCYYCRACYEEYYGAVEADIDATDGGGEVDVTDRDELVQAEGDVDVSGDLDALEGQREQDVGLRQDDEEDVLASDPTSEQVEVVSDEVVQERIEEAKPDHLRYERVELGSLADFLAGNVHVKDNKEPQIKMDIARGTQVPSTVETNHTDNTVSESPGDIDAPNKATCESIPAVPEPLTPSSDAEDAACAEDVLALDEDSAETETDKHEYSISKLLELRQHSPRDCPEALLGSPVRDDGTAPTPARNKPNNSRKKPKRSAASHRQNKTDVGPEEGDGQPSISPLPTLDLVDAMREALQTDSNAPCDNATGTAELLTGPAVCCR